MIFFWPVLFGRSAPQTYTPAVWEKKERTSVTAWDFSLGPCPTVTYWEDVNPNSATYCLTTMTEPK